MAGDTARPGQRGGRAHLRGDRGTAKVPRAIDVSGGQADQALLAEDCGTGSRSTAHRW